MNSIGNLPKNHYFRGKAENIVVFAFTYVLESFALFSGDCLQGDLYSVGWSEEAMKQGNEALNASLLQFLSIVKRFITSSLQFFIQRQTLHCCYFLKENIV